MSVLNNANILEHVLSVYLARYLGGGKSATYFLLGLLNEFKTTANIWTFLSCILNLHSTSSQPTMTSDLFPTNARDRKIWEVDPHLIGILTFSLHLSIYLLYYETIHRFNMLIILFMKNGRITTSHKITGTRQIHVIYITKLLKIMNHRWYSLKHSHYANTYNILHMSPSI